MRKKKFFFSFFLSEFFRILSENFFRLLAEKRQEVVKTNFYASRGTICGLKCILKVLNRFGFSAETFGMVLKFLNTCPEKKIAEETVFWFFFSEFFSDFQRKFFQNFGEKSSKSCQNYLLRDQRNNLLVEIFFKNFESFWIFGRNLWNGSQVSIYVSRVKFAEETVFWFFFSEFFSDFERKFFQTFGEKSLKSCQNYLLRDQRNNLLVEIFFKSFESFWIFCKNLWHGSQVSIYVSRVKFAEEKVFFSFFPSEFSGFWAKIFSDFWPKNVNNLSKLTSTRLRGTICGLKYFFESFKSFWIFCRNLWNGSQVSIYVSRVKFAEETVFWFFFSEFLSNFERKFFQTFGEKSTKSCQNYLLRDQRNNLLVEIFFKSFESFWIFCRNLWNGSQVSIYVSRVKFAEETVCWFFFSEFFSDFERKFFQTFGGKSSKSCQNYLLRDQRNNLLVEIFLKSFESFWIFRRNLWHGSQVSIYVSRVKFAEEKVFFHSSCLNFPDFERKFFQTFGRKTSIICQNYLLRVSEEQFVAWNIFLKVLNRFGFSAETFGMVLKFLYTCPE